MSDVATLFSPIKIGALDLPNRIIMAPLTRARATADTRVPTPLMAAYYAQRASAGLIISEATSVNAEGVGYVGTPGIWSEAQTEGWKQITRAVHQAGGRIVLQLWHVGRISDPSLLNNQPPVAPSAIAAKGHVSLLRPERPYPLPRAMTTAEIRATVEDFRRGAENAQKAGFDGVEIHGANGYLLDQFLQDGSNHRRDEYGGTIENRARLHLDVTDAAISVWGADRVGMHLAPRRDAHDMGDSDPLATFSYLARELDRRRIAFICAREYRAEDSIGPALRAAFKGAYIANEKFEFAASNAEIENGDADAIAFGKKFIANPDLVERFRRGAALNDLDVKTMYAHGPEGYVDYPALQSIAA
jgi:2,4-dienoyl-CoA reductase-like NADH-dependent reductase (Old Yellow Enzyme family)